MYSTMRPQHKAQDCGTGASLSLRRQCWASDRCCYEYDSHVSGLWASQGQWVAGACQRLSCKRRLSRTTYLCLQRCGKSVPCPPVRLICIFCACLVPYELVALTHTLTTALILTHTHTHICCNYCTYEILPPSRSLLLLLLFFTNFFGNSPLACGKPPTEKAIIVEWTAPTTRHFSSLPPDPIPIPIPFQSGWPIPCRWLALLCPALLCSGRAIISEMFWLALAFMLIYWLLRFCDKSVLLTWCDFASLVPSTLVLIFPLPCSCSTSSGTVVRPRCCGFKLPESFISSNLVLYLLDAAKV